LLVDATTPRLLSKTFIPQRVQIRLYVNSTSSCKYRTVLGSPSRPRRTYCSPSTYNLSHAVDLTDPDVLTQLKIEPADLLSHWKLDVIGGRVPPADSNPADDTNDRLPWTVHDFMLTAT